MLVGIAVALKLASLLAFSEKSLYSVEVLEDAVTRACNSQAALSPILSLIADVPLEHLEIGESLHESI